MIRSIELSDIDEIKRIHELYFKDEFHFPDLLKYLCVFVVEDEQGIITVGGIRDIAECVTITNKERSPKDRIKGLYQILDASIFVAQKMSYDQLYVWSQNLKWYKRLKRNGFRPSQGQSLILDL